MDVQVTCKADVAEDASYISGVFPVTDDDSLHVDTGWCICAGMTLVFCGCTCRYEFEVFYPEVAVLQITLWVGVPGPKAWAIFTILLTRQHRQLTGTSSDGSAVYRAAGLHSMVHEQICVRCAYNIAW